MSHDNLFNFDDNNMPWRMGNEIGYEISKIDKKKCFLILKLFFDFKNENNYFEFLNLIVKFKNKTRLERVLDSVQLCDQKTTVVLF